MVCLIITGLLLYLNASLVRHGRSILFIRNNFIVNLHYEFAQLGDRATHYTRRVLVTLGIIVVFKGRFSCESVASSRSSSFEVNLESPVSTTRGHFSLSQLRRLRLICSGYTAVSKICRGYLVIKRARNVRYSRILTSTCPLLRVLIIRCGHLGVFEAHSLALSAWVLH